MGYAFLLFLALLILAAAATSHSVPNDNETHLLMPSSVSAADPHDNDDQMTSLSWRLAVETGNIKNWKALPKNRICYVGQYMLGQQYDCAKEADSCEDDRVDECMKDTQYTFDCKAVVDSAIDYVNSLSDSKDSTDIWVFDIDETTLSNIPYYKKIRFGAEEYNWEMFYKWIEKAEAPAVPQVLKLYKALVSKKIKVVFLSGSPDLYEKERTENLKKVGYDNLEDLIILKSTEERGTSSVVFKSKKRCGLEKLGYRIVGNMGDQWSDLIGTHVGERTFKMPNPMYYVG